MPKNTGEHGLIFLGRDEKTYGKDGIGDVLYDPEIECGGPEGTPGRQCAFEPTKEHTQGLDLIGREGRKLHVGIASYRDPLCPKTLYNMYTKAEKPDDIHVRVLQQNDPEVDVDCFKEYCHLMSMRDIEGDDTEKDEKDYLDSCPYKDQIFIHDIHAKEAAGPTWARGLISKDLEEAHRQQSLSAQDHCMSLDSHMDFEDEWDRKMIHMWDEAKNEYAVLSTYVTDVVHLGHEEDAEVPHLCMVTFTSNVRTHATKSATNLSKPKLTNAVWGAGLSFSKCHAELKVMVDPHTPQVFDGEEFNRAARFWTHGYDIYTPNRVYVLHDYHKSQSNPVTRTWSNNGKVHGSFQDSNFRLKTMIDMPGGEEDSQKALRLKQTKFGLGDRRSLDQLIQFSGIDLRGMKPSIDGKNRCGNIQWVPFEEHQNGVNYIPKFDEETEDPLEPYLPGSVWYTSENEKLDASEEREGLPIINLEEKHSILRAEIEEEIQPSGDLAAKHAELREEIADVDKKNTLTEDLAAKLTASPNNNTPVAQNKLLRVGKKVEGFLVEHHFVPPEQHGFGQLPFIVQCSVFTLVVGLIIAIVRSAGTGRVFIRNDRKRAL